MRAFIFFGVMCAFALVLLCSCDGGSGDAQRELSVPSNFGKFTDGDVTCYYRYNAMSCVVVGNR